MLSLQCKLCRAPRATLLYDLEIGYFVSSRKNAPQSQPSSLYSSSEFRVVSAKASTPDGANAALRFPSSELEHPMVASRSRNMNELHFLELYCFFAFLRFFRFFAFLDFLDLRFFAFLDLRFFRFFIFSLG